MTDRQRDRQTDGQTDTFIDLTVSRQYNVNTYKLVTVESQRTWKEHIWATSWKNVSSGVSDQVRLKLVCSATETTMRLEILVTETRDMTQSRQRTTKALIRLRGCAGWSTPLLFAYYIRHFLMAWLIYIDTSVAITCINWGWTYFIN